MIVSQVALLGLSSLRGGHALVITNLEAVPLTFQIRYAINKADLLASGSDDAALDVVKGTLAFDPDLDAGAAPLWTRSGDLFAIAARRTIGPQRSAAVTLRQKTKIVPLGIPAVAGAVHLTLPVLAVGRTGAKQSAQLDHPARALVTAYQIVAYQGPLATDTRLAPQGFANPLPPPGGSIEFLIPPDQPPAAKRSARRGSRR
jgi:hypothetical protein